MTAFSIASIGTFCRRTACQLALVEPKCSCWNIAISRTGAHTTSPPHLPLQGHDSPLTAGGPSLHQNLVVMHPSLLDSFTCASVSPSPWLGGTSVGGHIIACMRVPSPVSISCAAPAPINQEHQQALCLQAVDVRNPVLVWTLPYCPVGAHSLGLHDSPESMGITGRYIVSIHT